MWDPGQRVLRNKMKSRSTFKEEGVPKGNMFLGSRLGKERQEAPLPYWRCWGSSELIAHLFGDIKTWLAELPTHS